MIYVVATIQLTAGNRPAFLNEQRHLLPLVLAEKGCLEYAPSVDVDAGIPKADPPRENVVVMHEKWETLDALKAHFVAPHMQEFRQTVKGMVVGTKVEVFEST